MGDLLNLLQEKGNNVTLFGIERANPAEAGRPNILK
jgi:hypothetical protein